ncbi:protein NO VEIN domain-containing protein [Spiroplasma endosymbiont of Cantharis nigra]|uniref:protein NO VEIN domain-containing protein n=1 Tax=Spiroplasma endosymbiont of Cantharis nigra TaxID=3066278 RepID=UPI0030D3CDA0
MIWEKILKFNKEFKSISGLKPLLKVNDQKTLEVKKILKSIAEEIMLFFNLDKNKINLSIGQGNITFTPWIGIDETNDLFMTIIFYPIEDGLTINICQKTEKLTKNKEGKQLLIKNREVLSNYLNNSFKDLNWKNSYPKSFEENKWDRGASYSKSSPISIFLNIEKSNFEEFNNYFLKVKNFFDFIKKDWKFKFATPDNYIDIFSKESKKDYNDVFDVIDKYYSYSFFESKDILLNLKEFDMENTKKANYNGINRLKHKEILNNKVLNGDKAEDHVVFFEKKSLINENRLDLAKMVRKLDTDGDGFDVLSYFPDGKIKRIEVKSSKNVKNKTIYISQREWELFESAKSIIYYVNESHRQVKIIKFKYPDFNKKNLIPTLYKINF